MYEIPSNIMKSINKFEPITVDGVVYHPISMSEYEEYLIAKPAIEFMQQSFRDIKLMTLPLLSAYYKVDYDALVKGEQPTGLLSRALLFLALSLKLGEGKPVTERLGNFSIVCDPNDESKLLHISFVDNNNKAQTITPVQFAVLREILACQNGIELMPDSANPDLVEAEQYLNSVNSANLDFKSEHLVSALSALSHVDESEIYNEWCVLKFVRRRESWERIINYITCGVGEMQGTSWKGGNPYPSMWFNKIKGSSSALVSLNSFVGGQAEKTVKAGLITQD